MYGDVHGERDFDLCLPALSARARFDSRNLSRLFALVGQAGQARKNRHVPLFHFRGLNDRDDANAVIAVELPSKEANEQVPGQSNCAAVPPPLSV